MSTTSKKRYRAYVLSQNVRSPWFATRAEVIDWVFANKYGNNRVAVEEGSAIRRTKATDARKGNHTHPPGRDKCRVCGV